MTEEEWRSDSELDRLIRLKGFSSEMSLRHISAGWDLNARLIHVNGFSSERRLRLFNAACSSQIVHLLSEPAKAALDAQERFADGLCSKQLLDELHDLEYAATMEAYPDGYTHSNAWYANQAASICSASSYLRYAESNLAESSCWYKAARYVAIGLKNLNSPHSQESDWRSKLELLQFLRDIFGNPFRPVSFDREWRTSTVVAIAKAMYESRDFSPMPILGDALQDAGCDHEEILTHCRSDGPHVKGCWVVDLVLGKE